MTVATLCIRCCCGCGRSSVVYATILVLFVSGSSATHEDLSRLIVPLYNVIIYAAVLSACVAVVFIFGIICRSKRLLVFSLGLQVLDRFVLIVPLNVKSSVLVPDNKLDCL